MRVLILGRGRMGTLVQQLAPGHGFEVAHVLGHDDAIDVIERLAPRAVDVAIDFTLPDAVPQNLPRLAALGIPVVVGTTGWQAHEPAMREVVEERGIGVVAAANFSVGMHLFQGVVEEAARRFAAHDAFGAFIHERHHHQKKDAPSGTALTIQAAMEAAGFPRFIDLSSTRAGFIPGTHTVGFDGPAETIELTHTARDRSVFARGALVAAKWVVGKRGWFGMREVVGR